MGRWIMRIGFILSCAAMTIIVGAANNLPAQAQESGHWHGLGVLVVTDRKAVNVEDRANHTVSMSEYDGAVYNGDLKSFLDKARYQVVSLIDVGTRGGYKIFTDADGSKVFAKYTVTES